MRVQAFRIVRREYASTAISGEGARRFGGRWNPPGWSMVYAAESIALATLELLVHLPALPLEKYCTIRLDFDASVIERLQPKTLPANWRRYAQPRSTQVLGRDWLKSQRSLVLAVPSAVIVDQMNYLINPEHPDIAEVTVSKPRSYRFDRRLFE